MFNKIIKCNNKYQIKYKIYLNKFNKINKMLNKYIKKKVNIENNKRKILKQKMKDKNFLIKYILKNFNLNQ